MKNKRSISCVLAGLLCAVMPLWGTVTINSGSFDFTVFYNPEGQNFAGQGTDAEWFFVARAKGSTDGDKDGTPLTTTGGNFSWSGDGGSSADYTYDVLDVRVDNPISIARGGVDYWITPASGTNYTRTPNPPNPSNLNEVDTGIRTRLNDSGFTDVQFTFDTVNSLFNGVSFADAGVDFLLFRDEPLGPVLVETAESELSWINVLSGHTHYNFGFSEQGEYSLVFNVQGRDGSGNPVGIPGSGTMNFNVIPEPQTYALFFGLAVLGWAFVRKMRR